MTAAYEDPAKTRMRLAVAIAIDQAGFSAVEEPIRVPLGDDSRLNGSLLGDAQSVDNEDIRTFYYLRPGNDAAVPKWIGNLARASHAANAGRVYMVVTEYVQDLVESCKETGAGLLRLTEDSQFELIVDYEETAPRTLEEARESHITELRRSMERRVELVRVDIEARHSQSAGIIAGMEGDAADRYMNQFDAEYRNLDDWGSDMSRRLDALGARSTTNEIGEVESLVQQGPPPIGDPDK
ncbi:hypothetical protein ACFPJ4_07445 [Lysinimonas soli]|uniref:Uncharacterized protein n=1 Tax=Lysinimonas soli TaxID=1074233 RepID=A0ABW0NS74_9MICO